MSLTLKQIAASFSVGQFDKVYQHLSENIIWNVVGENSFVGKKSVIDNCEQVAAYFKSVTTNFTTENSHSFGGEFVEILPNEFLKITDVFDNPELPGTMVTSVWFKK